MRKWITEISDVLRLRLRYSPLFHYRLAEHHKSSACRLRMKKVGIITFDKRVYGTGVEVLHGNGDQGKVVMLLHQSNYEVWADELESKAESSQKGEDMPGALPWPVLLGYCSTWHLHCSLKSIGYHNSPTYLIR